MVFSDKAFIFVFLPISFISFQICRRFFSGTASIVVLVALSAIFYSYWSIFYLGVLLVQILANYRLGQAMEKNPDGNWHKAVLILNLGLLGYFKYRNFFLENVEAATGIHFFITRLVVPLGISFHTFQQIALLFDVKDGEAKLPPLLNYIFFVMFFPQLIAGPIVLHSEMGAQIQYMRNSRGVIFQHFGPGLFLFMFGLWKKVCLADMLAPNIDLAFFPGVHLTTFESWIAGIGYPLQLYYDFSGYSDMAIGLGLIFGFLLPNNFNLPYRATSIIEYWKRWHITMTRFFMMYIYVPLSLNVTRYARKKKLSKSMIFVCSVLMPTLVTFLASGLWHGAGWTFIIFGLVFGIALVINHLWVELKAPKVGWLFGWLLTMLTVIVAEIYFRAISVTQANAMLKSMAWHLDLRPPTWLPSLLQPLHIPWRPSGTPIDYEWLRDAHVAVQVLAWLVILAPLALVLPALSVYPDRIIPSWRTAFGLSAMGLITVGLLDQPRSFLYFAF